MCYIQQIVYQAYIYSQWQISFTDLIYAELFFLSDLSYPTLQQQAGITGEKQNLFEIKFSLNCFEGK